MPLVGTEAQDAMLGTVITTGRRMDICATEPGTYAEATRTHSLGSKIGGLSYSRIGSAFPSGRKVTVGAITDGTVTRTGMATHWALTDGVDTLVAAGPLAASQAVTSGNDFSLAAFDIVLPDAT